jgi:hypothetical protein
LFPNRLKETYSCVEERARDAVELVAATDREHLSTPTGDQAELRNGVGNSAQRNICGQHDSQHAAAKVYDKTRMLSQSEEFTKTDAKDVQENQEPNQNKDRSDLGCNLSAKSRKSANEADDIPRPCPHTDCQGQLQSQRRLYCLPYRCFGCRATFARQEILQGHECKVKAGGEILDFPLVCAVVKGCIKLDDMENIV